MLNENIRATNAVLTVFNKPTAYLSSNFALYLLPFLHKLYLIKGVHRTLYAQYLRRNHPHSNHAIALTLE